MFSQYQMVPLMIIWKLFISISFLDKILPFLMSLYTYKHNRINTVQPLKSRLKSKKGSGLSNHFPQIQTFFWIWGKWFKTLPRLLWFLSKLGLKPYPSNPDKGLDLRKWFDNPDPFLDLREYKYSLDYPFMGLDLRGWTVFPSF